MSTSSILLQLVQGDAGAEWSANKGGWNAEENECNWEGISCDEAGNVVQIELPNSGLQGTIPPSLAQISTLRLLNLSGNALRGDIPASLWKHLQLGVLNLSYNELTGTLPQSGGVFVQLLLASNQLHGSLPHDLGEQSKMATVLDLSDNQFTGTIPTNLDNMFFLLDLDLSKNRLEGTIPKSLGHLYNVQRLALNDNHLYGEIPESIASEGLGLEYLALHNNKLSGPINADLANLSELKTLLLGNNRFTGIVPKPLCDRNLNEVLFTTDSNDNDAEKNRNGCNSVACPAGTSSEDNQGLYPCVSCQEGFVNPYVGASTCNEMTDADIYRLLQPAFVGTNPCNEDGVRCNREGRITAILLEKKLLQGTIPQELGYLPFLEELDLSDNFLQGTIPSTLHFAPLQRLDLSSNFLTGQVPPELCEKKGVNDNGKDGVYSCDILACPVGTFSPTGHAAPGVMGGACFACTHGAKDMTTLASRDCKLRPLSKAREESTEAPTIGMTEIAKIVVIVVAVLGVFLYFWIRRKTRRSPQVAMILKHKEKSKDLAQTERTRLDDWYESESEYDAEDDMVMEIPEYVDDDDGVDHDDDEADLEEERLISEQRQQNVSSNTSML